ncbi:MAG TPA: T9SS type A sorting domain-containing protein [Bacteroidia bacterium]|jgi:hypothetical protein|nr:T9SS type A sorting domain-containing protein [Bacteroidia bacterium]
MKKLLFILLLACFCITGKAQVLNTAFCQANGNVEAVAIDSANNVVYIGGNFTSVCGSARSRLAALNLTTGALLPWNPGANNDVKALYVYRGALYVGGSFTTIGGQSRTYAAKFYTAAGTITSWSVNITTGSYVGTIAALNNHVYLGGNFLLTIATGNDLCEVDTTAGTASSWSGYPNNIVNSLAIHGTSLYAGGKFTQVGSTSQNYFAEFDLSSGGSLTTLNPNPDAEVTAVLAQSGRLFLGGSFTFLNGGTGRSGLAEIDPSSGSALSWNPGVNNPPAQLVYRNGIIYVVGNGFSVIGGKSRSFMAAVDATTGWVSNWNLSLNASAFTAAATSNQVFVGGAMSSVLGSGRNNFAVVCINPIDTLYPGINGPATVCSGVNGLSYSVTPVTGATSYSWTYSGTGATIHGTTNPVTIDFSSSATSGTLTVKATNGCETSNTQTVSINAYTFTTTVSAGSSNITCGDSTNISSSDNYLGSGSVTYSWTPSTALNSTNTNQTKTGTKITRTYTLTEISTEGCVATGVATVTVTPYGLSPTSASSSILCSTADSLHVTNNYPGAGTVTYTWSPSTSLSSAHAANLAASPVANTDYTVTSSTSDGCVAAAQMITVNVDPISLNTSSAPGTITCGDATSLSASNNYPGTGTLTYTWSPSTALSNTHITNPTANPVSNTTYTLTLKSPEGCISTSAVTVNVDPLQVNITNTVSTSCHAPVTLNTSANTSNTNLTYSWTPSTGLNNATAASPTAVIGQNTTYNVTMSLPSSGCANASNSISVSLTLPVTPQICMVTVDSASTHNIVYWDKTSFANAAIDSFRIYREVTTNVYSIVGTVHYSALSVFHDYSANPNVTTYRYKISVLDSCGNESALSPYHNTVYMIYVGSGLYTWNPGYTIEPNINPVNNYLLMRDDNNVGLWHQVASTTGNQNTIADPSWASYPNANWQVVTSWAISCTPTVRQSNGTQSAIVRSKSNISNNRTTGFGQLAANGDQFALYPNPTNGNITVSFNNATQGKTTIKITSLLGEEVYAETLDQKNDSRTIDMSKQAAGVYLVQVTSNNTTTIKRIVKN